MEYTALISADYIMKVAVVAVVLVSGSFLTSHAFLKDSSALILSSKLVGPKHSRSSKQNDQAVASKSAIKAALQEAELSSDDISIIELRHGSDRNVQQVLVELHVSEYGQATPVSHPFVGSTGLVGLCELGKFSFIPFV